MLSVLLQESIVFVELCGVPSVQLFPPDVGNLQAEILVRFNINCLTWVQEDFCKFTSQDSQELH